MMNRLQKTTATLALMGLALGLGACDDDPSGPDLPAQYNVEVSGEQFTVEVTTQAQEGVINGQIVAGDAGYNDPWSWHMVPATVEAVDAAIEVCDGRPSMVEADLDYWLDTVGRFCPWGATVVSRVEA